MDFNQATEYLSSLAVFGIRPGLGRTAKALELLGLPHSCRLIHVAGTNGKGSTTAFAASVLTEAGYPAGFYTSPYVFRVNERIGLGYEYISDSDFALCVEKIRAINAILKSDGEVLTEFEAKTAAAFVYFAAKKAQYAVIECGMGGRSDATNVITPCVSIIASVGLDHTEWLGGTIREIAAEKAGIIKQGIPCVTGASGEALEEIDKAGAACNSRVYALGRDFAISGTGPYTLEAEDFTIEGLQPTLRGSFQPGNAAMAAMAVKLAQPDISDTAVRSGISRAWLPGRFQLAAKAPDTYLDGAHNGPAAAELAKTIGALPRENRVLVIGMLRNHDPRPVLEALAPMFQQAVVTNSTSPRALPAEELAETARKYMPCTIEPEVNRAAALARSLAGPGGQVIITGSFYTIGEVDINVLDNHRGK